jgi:hypothetical protein
MKQRAARWRNHTHSRGPVTHRGVFRECREQAGLPYHLAMIRASACLVTRSCGDTAERAGLLDAEGITFDLV